MWADRIVDFWPPCWLPVEVKTLPVLPSSLFGIGCENALVVW